MEQRTHKSDARWRLEEVIAFECAAAKDEREDWTVLRERDAELPVSEADFTSERRGALALRWLGRRLEREPKIRLAADSVSQSLSVAGQLLAAAGFLMGLGSATAALAYTGQAPINVSAFFGLFILLQTVFAVALLAIFLLPRKGKETLAFASVFSLGRWALGALFAKAQAMSARFLSGQRRQDAAELAGAARRGFLTHGVLAKWVAFVKVQAAALCFNLGALTALLVAVSFSDRAFGWQTTLSVSTESIYSLVRFVALPWSWFYGEGLGYPNAAQIEGSRIVLKEGIQSLENEALSAWWRFLALGIACYGILPRLLFWVLGKWQVRGALGRYDFRNAAVERLLQRLRPAAAYFEAEPVPVGQGASARLANEERDIAVGESQRVRCLCSREFGEAFDLEALRTILARRWRLPPESVTVATYEEGRLADQAVGTAEDEQVAVVFESWMPPIKELERQLKALRETLDARSLIKLILVGIPDSAGNAISLKPEIQYAEVWRSFVRRLGDPYLILENPAA